MSGITNALSMYFQGDSATDAANIQAQAARYVADLQAKYSDKALEFQKNMWKKAESDFFPYLHSGSQGLKQLSRELPQYLENVLDPNAQAFINHQDGPLPSADFKIDPVTGQVIQGDGDMSDPSSSGVLSPDTPELQQSLRDFEFDTEDPVYQQKLAEKNEAIDSFLAKQGLQGSSAGESFRQKELDKLMADEESRQYGRTMDLANAGVQEYGLAADRGNTLYNRISGQQSDYYSRMLSNTLTQAEQDKAKLLQNYDVSKDLYGLQYGSALDLAKMGAGAASSAGSGSITTGQGLANTTMQTSAGLAAAANQAADAQAQAALSQGQAWAGGLQSLGSSLSGFGNYALQNWVQPHYQQPNSYNPYSYGGGGMNTGAPTHVGAGGTTAYGM